MTTFTIIVAVVGSVLSLAAWWGCHWLASRMERDDNRDRGIE